MAEVVVVYWRDIPAQVIVGKGRAASKVQLPERFEQAIDRCAMKIGAKDADAYLAEWRKAPAYEMDGISDEIARIEAARLEAAYDTDRIKVLIGNDGWEAPKANAILGEMAMALFQFKSDTAPSASNADVEAFLAGYSIEVMPRTAEKIEDFRAILPAQTRVYIAHIDGTSIEDMAATAARITAEGYTVMPHFPARIIKDRATLGDWVARYKDVGVRQGLLLAGGVPAPVGDYATSMQLLESGAFDGFDRLHVAGHPEGNRDIDPDGSDRAVMEAARWKYAFSQRTDAKMAMATQFCFEPQPVIDWAQRLSNEGVGLPVHIGIAGPAKLQTLIKFAIACGVGPSLRVLQKRAMDVTKLLLPYNPDEVIAGLAAHKAKHPNFAIEQVHFFPLGGIKTNATWAAEHGGPACQPAQ